MFLIRNACRMKRIPWQQQQQQQQTARHIHDISVPRHRTDDFLSSAAFLPSRALTAQPRLNKSDDRLPLPLPLPLVAAERPAAPARLNDLDVQLANLYDHFDLKLRLSSPVNLNVARHREVEVVPASSLALPPLPPLPPPPLTRIHAKSSPGTVGSVVGDSPTAIAPPLRRDYRIPIVEPEKPVSVVISDGRQSGERVVIGDQLSSNSIVEIIGDRMDNLIKKEAKIIMQIRRSKMNKHKLRKWRRKYRHFLKIKWETYEKRAAQALDDAVAAIHDDADKFNPVDKVRRNIDLAKEMGYKATFYQELPLAKWLDEKKDKDAAEAERFTDRNRERYRKIPPWDYEKF